MRLQLLLFSTLCITSLGCQAQKPVREVLHAPGKHTLILSGDEAGEAVLIDRYDAFFERVTLTELSIQTKRPLADLTAMGREKALVAYQHFLKSDIVDFSPSESAWVAAVMESVYQDVEAVSPGRFPDTIWLAKTSARHYGPSTYYTRENGIIIPQDVLRNRNEKAFKSTMIHEVFHIISRLNPDLRAKLYQMIGFTDIGYDNLEMPQTLRDNLLHNPDGVDFAQKIDLEQPDGSTLSAIPIIYAKENGFQPGIGTFFGYLEFALFPVEQLPTGKWKVTTKADGRSSPINLGEQPDFWRQIRKNTNYIIHPDEILADNFAFLIQSKQDPGIIASFTEEGKALIDALEEAIR
jgi:hypothetical protein